MRDCKIRYTEHGDIKSCDACGCEDMPTVEFTETSGRLHGQKVTLCEFCWSSQAYYVLHYNEIHTSTTNEDIARMICQAVHYLEKKMRLSEEPKDPCGMSASGSEHGGGR